MHSPLRLLLIAQICLLTCLAVCILLIPHFLFEANEGGVSNYGTYARTVVPYSLGFGICGLFTILAALHCPSTHALRPLLITLGLLYLFVLFSTYPYKQRPFYDTLHHIAGMLLVGYTLAMGTWLALFKVPSVRSRLLFAVQLCGFLLALLTVTGTLHLLFIAELLENTAFGAVLLSSV